VDPSPPPAMSLRAQLNMDERDYEAAVELRNLTTESAFGFTPEMAAELAVMMVNADKIPFALIVACIASVGQVKKNVTTNELMRKLEDIFELSTSNKDGAKSINFGAVRMIGMLFLEWFSGGISVLERISDKAGNCWTANKFPSTDAGDINKELRNTFEDKSWTPPIIDEAKKTVIAAGLKKWYENLKGNYSDDMKKKYKDNLAAAMKT
jgi:hypothetical protein